MPAAAAAPFEVEPAPVLRGETVGEGAGKPIVLCHGITATRGGVLHGSRLLERGGFRVLRYDARGHGESDPAPAGEGYGYPQLVGDLERLVEAELGSGRFLLAGSSMGAHTAVAYALAHPERLTGLVVIGPAYAGEPISAASAAYWDGLAAALEADGIDAFVAYIGREQPIAPAYRDSVLRFTRERMAAHRDLGAVAQALRETPRSRPFGGLDELRAIATPTLVVASGDEADPGHPHAVAVAYAEAIPGAKLVGEGEGESPLAWQGGKLSREIASFGEALSWSTSQLV
jgi:pimeloyl-ACP methyl ester carboxylesterase